MLLNPATITVVGQAQEQLVEVRRKLADLSGLQNVLQDLIGQCRHGTIAQCRIIEALAPAAD